MKIKVGWTYVGIIGVFIAIFFTGALADIDPGPDTMVLNGGTIGDVPFPHRVHQKTLGDCNICHAIFPHEVGSIDRLKGEAVLKKKAVMKQCVQCHRKKSTAGEKAGPIRCKTCHTPKS